MPKDTPQPEKTVRERGTYAKHGDDPTLKSYLSSLFFILSVPGLIAISYVGYLHGWYPYSLLPLVFGALLLGALTAVFTLMHYLT